MVKFLRWADNMGVYEDALSYLINTPNKKLECLIKQAEGELEEFENCEDLCSDAGACPID